MRERDSEACSGGTGRERVREFLKFLNRNRGKREEEREEKLKEQRKMRAHTDR